MKYDLSILQEYLDKDLLEVQSHPTLPLKIYNYSRECAWEKKWDEITLNMRGTILDEEGNLIARGFPKFFNYEELQPNDIPLEPFHVYEKMDGSLGIFFSYDGKWHMATRGSFTSDQAIRGMKIAEIYNIPSVCVPGYTYLVEIIYPENQIVVHYNTERLTLLSIIDNKGNEVLDYHNHFETYMELGWDLPERYDSDNFDKLKKLVEFNKEGFVIRFNSGMRMKIKGEEYVRLHSLMTKFSNVDIWDCLSKGTSIDLERVPDEFDAWVKKTIKELKYNHYTIWNQVVKEFQYHEYGKYNDLEPTLTKKEFAEWVMTKPKWKQALLFKLYERKDISPIIWKLIKPKYQKPFWNKEIDN